MTSNATTVYTAPTMKDLSFVLPIADRLWTGFGLVRPSQTGNAVTRVCKYIEHMPYVDGMIGDPWWQVELGHITWGVRAEHPVDVWLLDVAARHSS